MGKTQKPNESPAQHNVEDLLNQIAELTERVQQNSEDEKIQRALYRIADVTGSSEDVAAFYAELHDIVGELTSAKACFIALYHEEKQCISFPYYADEHDDPYKKEKPIDDPDAEELPLHLKPMIPIKDLENSWTLRVIRSNQQLHQREEDLECGIGTAASDWLGVPLRYNGKPIGVLVVQSYEPGFYYTDRDVELVNFVSHHIATALQRRRDALAIELANKKLQASSEELEDANLQLTQQIEAKERINKRMIELSHQAGKAEVATGVLHNVGNVLNSVSVSVGLVQETLQASKLNSLNKAAALLEEQPNLKDFFDNDQRGTAFPGYLLRLSEQLLDEQYAVTDELKTLHEHLEHIKTVVSMQQSYAGISGLKETVSLPDMIKDAELLVSSSFEKHMIDVERDYDDFPLVAIEKQKIMQILVNLMKNAKDAITTHRERDREMCIRVKKKTAGRLTISIEDNGVGISEEAMTKIFSHGFTTKVDGHGYGLHSCANAAKEMGGKLTATSEGLGTGAAFTLEVPYEEA